MLKLGEQTTVDDRSKEFVSRRNLRKISTLDRFEFLNLSGLMELEEATMERIAPWSFSKFKKVCSSHGEKMPKPPLASEEKPRVCFVAFVP